MDGGPAGSNGGQEAREYRFYCACGYPQCLVTIALTYTSYPAPPGTTRRQDLNILSLPLTSWMTLGNAAAAADVDKYNDTNNDASS